MSRKYLALFLRFLSLATVGGALLTAVQFVRGALPNPALFIFPAPEPITGAFAPMQWIFNLYGWISGIGVYLGAGLLFGMVLAQLARIAELGWAKYQQEQKKLREEEAARVKIERRKAERQRLKDLARAKRKPSSVGAVLFGIVIGWLFFH